MQLTVTGRHVDITEPIREYATRKVERGLVEFPWIESVHVILAVEKYRHEAELVIQGAHRLRVDARAESDDMYASIDGAIHKAVRQMRKVRGKVTDHKTREPLAEVEKVLRPAEEQGS